MRQGHCYSVLFSVWHTTGIMLNDFSSPLQIYSSTSPPSSVDHIFFSGVSSWVQLYPWEFGGWREREIGVFFTRAHFQLGWIGNGCLLPEGHSSCQMAFACSYSSGSVASTNHSSPYPIKPRSFPLLLVLGCFADFP